MKPLCIHVDPLIFAITYKKYNTYRKELLTINPRMKAWLGGSFLACESPILTLAKILTF
jgi:hypothetical protein